MIEQMCSDAHSITLTVICIVLTTPGIYFRCDIIVKHLTEGSNKNESIFCIVNISHSVNLTIT